jgi:DNA-binding XRE family transcriptional regulator
MFTENARIYVLGINSRWHQETQPKVAKIIELSKNTYARYDNEASILKDIKT